MSWRRGRSMPSRGSRCGGSPLRSRRRRHLRQTGEAVHVVIRWSGAHAEPWRGIPLVWYPRSDGRRQARSGPHNMLVERADGSRCVMNYNFRRFLREPPQS